MKKALIFLNAFMAVSASFAAEEQADSLKMVNLEEVIVSSTRAGSNTPVAYSNMDRQAIESRNFGQDIPFLISSTPSVIVTSDAGTGIGYAGFRIRGVDANRINVTANGIPLNDSESHGVFWVNMPDFASSLQDLQIQRGVGTSTNGAGAFGASINMKTETIPTQKGGELETGYGSFNTSKLTFKLGTGKIGEHFAFNGRISSITSDGFIDRASVDLKSYFSQGAYFDEKTLLKFITFGGNERTYHAWDGVPDYILSDIFMENNRTYNPSGYMGDDANGNPLYYKNQTDNFRQTHYQLILLQRLSDNLNLNSALHYTRGKGYYEEYKTGRILEEFGLTSDVEEDDLVRQKWLDNDFFGGVFSLDYTRDNWNVSLGGGANQYAGNHFGKVIWTKETNYLNHEYYRSKADKIDVNIYLKGNYKISETLSLYGDLQYRFIDYKTKGLHDTWDRINGKMQDICVDKQFNFFNPKAGAFYQIDAQNSAYGSFAVAHREPNRNNYTENIGEKPRAEQLFDYELGYKFDSCIFSAGLNLYYMQYADQLALNGKVNEIGEPLTSNVPHSYRAGIELLAGIQITRELKWEGNLTWSCSRIKNYTEYVLVDDGYAPQQEDYYGNTPIAYSPDLIANSLLSCQKNGFRAALQSAYVGKQCLDNTGRNDRMIDAYCVSNLRLGYDFKKKHISVDLLINNFFDEEYETNGWVWAAYYSDGQGGLSPYTEKSYFPQAGTNFMAKVGIRF